MATDRNRARLVGVSEVRGSAGGKYRLLGAPQISQICIHKFIQLDGGSIASHALIPEEFSGY